MLHAFMHNYVLSRNIDLKELLFHFIDRNYSRMMIPSYQRSRFLHLYTYMYVNFINEFGELIFYFSLLLIEVFIAVRFGFIRFIT